LPPRWRSDEGIPTNRELDGRAGAEAIAWLPVRLFEAKYSSGSRDFRPGRRRTELEETGRFLATVRCESVPERAGDFYAAVKLHSGNQSGNRIEFTGIISRAEGVEGGRRYHPRCRRAVCFFVVRAPLVRGGLRETSMTWRARIQKGQRFLRYICSMIRRSLGLSTWDRAAIRHTNADGATHATTTRRSWRR
jgi:hypothetical protein